jgi:hypothetical protein
MVSQGFLFLGILRGYRGSRINSENTFINGSRLNGTLMKKKLKFEPSKFAFFTSVVFTIILCFTLLDYIFHRIGPEKSLSSWYFAVKIVYGTLIGSLTYWLIRKRNIIVQALVFAVITSIFLQIQYYFEGIPMLLSLLFFAIHVGFLFCASWIFFKVFNPAERI